MDMASFGKSEVDEERLDWTILRDGGIYLYLREQFLQEDLEKLRSYGYLVVSFDCTEWDSDGEWHAELKMHESFEKALSFPSYYGRNLNALDECMMEDIEVPEVGGLAIVLHNCDRFCTKKALKDVLTTVLSIFAKASREHMLMGKRFLTLVQTNDPTTHFDVLDCVHGVWNYREWLNKARGL